jgi:hypothetical protein
MLYKTNLYKDKIMEFFDKEDKTGEELKDNDVGEKEKI